MIADRRLFAALEAAPAAWSRARPAHDVRLVARCCRLKARIVAADEHDRRGWREQLNFGHTIGHALEGDGRRGLLHGEAVGLGMLAACAIAEANGVAHAAVSERLRSLLVRLGLPVTLRAPLQHRLLQRAWQRDKKAHAGVPRFVLTPRIGAASVGHRVSEAQIVRAVRVIVGPHLVSHPRTLPRPRAALRRGEE
jgi:3-dehydroquinate synthase